MDYKKGIAATRGLYKYVIIAFLYLAPCHPGGETLTPGFPQEFCKMGYGRKGCVRPQALGVKDLHGHIRRQHQ